MGMVVGSLKTERAARSLGPSLGWPWLCMVDTRQERISPLWGNDSARETVRYALLSTTPVTPVPPPLGVGAPHRIFGW